MVSDFPCGLMITDLHDRHILQVNSYIVDTAGKSEGELVGVPLSCLLSKASMIFMESYVYPSLLDQGIHSELQLTLKTHADGRLPIVANVRFDGERLIYWSIFSAVERDKLYQELIDARDQLEQQALRLKELAATDPLTGLLNRRAAEDKMLGMLAKTLRVPAPLTLVVFEIDQLDSIRQQLGEASADAVLKSFAESIHDVFRNVDVVTRWNEGKFMAMCYNATAEEAWVMCEDLHHVAIQMTIDGGQISLSIGIVSMSLSKNNTEEILSSAITKADAALYISVASGRGQTTVFEH
jgi:diguanylate cyclase (GGDEF)-like protein